MNIQNKEGDLYIYNWVVHIKRYNFSLFWMFFRQPWTKVSSTFLLMMLIAASSPCIGRCVITSSLYHRVYIYTYIRNVERYSLSSNMKKSVIKVFKKTLQKPFSAIDYDTYCIRGAEEIVQNNIILCLHFCRCFSKIYIYLV